MSSVPARPGAPVPAPEPERPARGDLVEQGRGAHRVVGQFRGGRRRALALGTRPDPGAARFRPRRTGRAPAAPDRRSCSRGRGRQGPQPIVARRSHPIPRCLRACSRRRTRRTAPCAGAIRRTPSPAGTGRKDQPRSIATIASHSTPRSRPGTSIRRSSRRRARFSSGADRRPVDGRSADRVQRLPFASTRFRPIPRCRRAVPCRCRRRRGRCAPGHCHKRRLTRCAQEDPIAPRESISSRPRSRSRRTGRRWIARRRRPDGFAPRHRRRSPARQRAGGEHRSPSIPRERCRLVLRRSRGAWAIPPADVLRRQLAAAQIRAGHFAAAGTPFGEPCTAFAAGTARFAASIPAAPCTRPVFRPRLRA